MLKSDSCTIVAKHAWILGLGIRAECWKAEARTMPRASSKEADTSAYFTNEKNKLFVPSA